MSTVIGREAKLKGDKAQLKYVPRSVVRCERELVQQDMVKCECELVQHSTHAMIAQAASAGYWLHDGPKNSKRSRTRSTRSRMR